MKFFVAPFKLTAGLIGLVSLLVLLPGDGFAGTTGKDGGIWRSRSLFGSYLAGRYARGQRDMWSAAKFYRRALERDPTNQSILKQAFITEASIGEWSRAGRLAEAVAAMQGNHRLARVFLGIRAFKAGDYRAAKKQFAKSNVGPIGELTSSLDSAWALLALGKPDVALARLDQLKKQEWSKFYLSYHRALIADVAGLDAEAEKSYAEVFKSDTRTVRVALAYARHVAAKGDKKRARSILAEHVRNLTGRHGLVSALLRELAGDQPTAKFITTPEEGLAEVFFGLGEALTGEGGIDIGTIYLRYAHYLRPNFPMADYALASVYEVTKKYDRAIEFYSHIPLSSPISVDAEIRRALNLNWLKRPDDAKAVLVDLLARQPATGRGGQAAAGGETGSGIATPTTVFRLGNRGPEVRRIQDALRTGGLTVGPSDGFFGIKTRQAVVAFQRNHKFPADGIVGPQTWRALMASNGGEGVAQPNRKRSRILMTLAGILRGQKKYAEAAGHYSEAIAMIKEPKQRHWNHYYSRGVCYERMKQWAKAEADLKTALKLNPNQPLVLNYLGYSWVDQGLNLGPAMALIRKAVKIKPDDGYIVDSLGWAYFRQGNFDAAVRYLERAASLRPDDPTINDHLGDAYWRVGRRVEARFQWSQALVLKPDAEAIPPIRTKLEAGLPDLPKARVVKRSPRRRVMSKKPASVIANDPEPFAR